MLDSSALFAFFTGEVGAQLVENHLAGAAISTVNVQEIAKSMVEAGADHQEVRTAIGSLPLDICRHDFGDALLAASLAPATKRFGRGLRDRSCMALAIRLGVPALTMDRAWAERHTGAHRRVGAVATVRLA